MQCTVGNLITQKGLSWGAWAQIAKPSNCGINYQIKRLMITAAAMGCNGIDAAAIPQTTCSGALLAARHPCACRPLCNSTARHSIPALLLCLTQHQLPLLLLALNNVCSIEHTKQRMLNRAYHPAKLNLMLSVNSTANSKWF